VTDLERFALRQAVPRAGLPALSADANDFDLRMRLFAICVYLAMYEHGDVATIVMAAGGGLPAEGEPQ
jgi:hypothetical protein